jgi:hypothetical protein
MNATINQIPRPRITIPPWVILVRRKNINMTIQNNARTRTIAPGEFTDDIRASRLRLDDFVRDIFRSEIIGQYFGRNLSISWWVWGCSSNEGLQ